MFNSVRTVNEASGMTWAGDCRYAFGFGEDESLWVHGFRLNEIPEAFHLIPSEAYAGSRFSGTGVWAKEPPFCRLLAIGRLLHWEYEPDALGF